MSVAARHTMTLELELEAGTVRELDAARRLLAQRVAAVVPFAPLAAPVVAGGGRVRVLYARVSSPGLRRPIELRPHTRIANEGGEA